MIPNSSSSRNKLHLHLNFRNPVSYRYGTCISVGKYRIFFQDNRILKAPRGVFFCKAFLGFTPFKRTGNQYPFLYDPDRFSFLYEKNFLRTRCGNVVFFLSYLRRICRRHITENTKSIFQNFLPSIAILIQIQGFFFVGCFYSF